MSLIESSSPYQRKREPNKMLCISCTKLLNNAEGEDEIVEDEAGEERKASDKGIN
jgi:hypothetical protein